MTIPKITAYDGVILFLRKNNDINKMFGYDYKRAF